MSLSQILASIDSEVSRLEQSRKLLALYGVTTSRSRTRNSPSKSKGRRKHVLSAEARERIAAAQRKRWAARKKAAK